MCGIAGLWNFKADDLAAGSFAAFTAALAHRGPDGQGVEHFAEDRLHLGHRRLAIIDLSARGNQPMAYADGRYWLIFNGEIYNFVELRRELEALGHRFVSDSDSEVVLAAFAQWGEDCQLRFNGMWALAIWDRREKNMFLSRDRFGVKPLHYALDNGRFAFASELKAFLALPWWNGSLDDAVLAETLANINGGEGSEVTLLPRVKRLLGGHSLRLSADGTATVKRWWNTLDHLRAVPRGLAQQAEEFRALFDDACRIRLRSDVPVATSLSGGLDSSAVAGTIAEVARGGTADRLQKDWQRAFVACFPGTNLDEERYARRVIDHFGLTGRYYVVDETEALRHLEDIVFAYESVYWVPLVGPWSIYRQMRQDGVVVSLDGHGADELLGGYHFFVERELEALLGVNFRLGRYRDLKRTLAGMVGGSADQLNVGMAGDMRLLARRLLAKSGLGAPVRRMRGLAGAAKRALLGPPPVVAGPAAPPPVTAAPLLNPLSRPSQLYDEGSDPRYRDMTSLGRGLYIWFHHNVLPTLLRNYDRASMAHGIEVRMPFMDWRLVTFAFSLPDESKIGGGYTKRIVREAMTGRLPEDIRLRTNKIGFTSPTDQWMRGALRNWVADSVSDRKFRESDVWNGPAVRQAVERALAGTGGFGPIWPILNAYALQQRFSRESMTHRHMATQV